MRRCRLQINTMSNLTDKKIAVLMGGPGSERAVSLTSGAGVAKALRSLGAKILEGRGGAQHVCPATIPDGLTRAIQDLALRAHRALGLQVYSRVDLMLAPQGEPFVLEVNTIPGMTEVSLLPDAAAAAGISYTELCARIIELSHASGRAAK
jgi:D-alanine-D-alanine ligase-like ATP-grasp enzyme